MGEIAIQVEGLGKLYYIAGSRGVYRTFRETLTDAVVAPFRRLGKLLRGRATGAADLDETIWALRDVSFEIGRGEVTGIIGRNGAGKSTLLKILSRITEPTEGCARIRGRVGSLLEVGTGFHPELSGRENIFLNGAILGMGRGEIERKFDEIVAFAEVERFIDTPVKHYSSGMAVRLAFAVAAHLEPEILMVDEVLAVGDARFQKKCLGKMNSIAGEGRTVLLVSHNMGSILDLCKTAIWLHQGRLTAQGEVNSVVHQYQRSLQDEDPARTLAKNGDVSFGRVSLGPDGGNVLEAGAPARLEACFGVNVAQSGFSLVCIVENSRGETVVYSRVESGELSGYSSDHRQYEIEVDLPPLWLSPGVYTVYFRAHIQGALKSRGIYESDQVPFTIVGAANPAAALLNPPAKWSVEAKS